MTFCKNSTLQYNTQMTLHIQTEFPKNINASQHWHSKGVVRTHPWLPAPAPDAGTGGGGPRPIYVHPARSGGCGGREQCVVCCVVLWGHTAGRGQNTGGPPGQSGGEME